MALGLGFEQLVGQAGQLCDALAELGDDVGRRAHADPRAQQVGHLTAHRGRDMLEQQQPRASR